MKNSYNYISENMIDGMRFLALLDNHKMFIDMGTSYNLSGRYIRCVYNRNVEGEQIDYH